MTPTTHLNTQMHTYLKTQSLYEQCMKKERRGNTNIGKSGEQRRTPWRSNTDHPRDPTEIKAYREELLDL